MLRLRKLAAVVAGSAVLTTTLMSANYGIPVENRKWQMIGVTGLYTYGTGNTWPTLNLGSSDIGIIDLVDDDDIITWDANNSIGNANNAYGLAADYNGYPTSTYTPVIFTSDGTSSGSAVLTYESNGSTYGQPFHSIVGLRAMNHTDSNLLRAAISINYDVKVNTKAYESPMRVMYIKSKYVKTSTSQPDVAVYYQATMEGQTFRITFADDTTFNYSSTDTSDPIYAGVFSRDYTWDSPASTTSGLSMVTEASGGGGVEFAAIDEVFDMNITNNKSSTTGVNWNFNLPTDTGTDSSGNTIGDLLEDLEGNLTVYEWDNTGDDTTSKWKPAWFYRTPGDPAVSTDSLNEIASNQFTKGKGYWVRFSEANGASVGTDYDVSLKPSIPGFLVSDAITKTDYTSDLVKPGWNLISFEDEALRYSTTGIAIPIATANDFNLTTAFGEKFFMFNQNGAEANSMCQRINSAIDGNNTYNSYTSSAQTNIRCYPANDGASSYLMLISDKTFFVDINGSVSHEVEANVPYTLTGTSLATHHDANLSLTGGNGVGAIGVSTSGIRYRSRYGEYVLGLETNNELYKYGATAAMTGKGSIVLSLPPFEKTDTSGGATTGTITLPANWVAADFTNSESQIITDTETAIATLVAAAAPVKYGQDIYASGTTTGTSAAVGNAWMINANSNNADGNETLLIAMNKRFYAADATYIRVFDILWGDVGGSVYISAGGSSAGPLQFSNAANTITVNGSTKPGRTCDLIATNITSQNGVSAFCLDQGTSVTDDNNSVMFIGATNINYDVKEGNTTMDLITEKTWKTSAAKDANNSVYGMIKAVYTGSGLSKGSISSAGAITVTPYSTNLRANPIWAEDFPNDGPLNYITQIDDGAGAFLKPEVFLTSVTHTDNTTSGTTAGTFTGTISWKALDATRNPAEWFDDANNFELFWTSQGRGYWVYTSAGYTNPVTINETKTDYTREYYKHFDNTLDANGYALTYNHVDGSISTFIGGLYRTSALAGQTYTSGSSYNVETTLGGSKNPMLTSSGISSTAEVRFAMVANDYETNGFVEASSPYSADIQAVDGLGGKATLSTSLDFVKPASPVATLDPTNSAITNIASTYGKYVYLYENNISDRTFESDVKVVIEGSIDATTNISTIPVDFTATTVTSQFTYPAAVNPSSAPVTLTGSSSLTANSPIRDLRYVVATQPKALVRQATMSDQLKASFAPIYAGTQVLQVTANGELDKFPKDYSVSPAVQKTTDSGIQLTNATSYTVAMSYVAAAGAPSIAGDFTHIIHVGDANGVFATIGYNSAYVGKYFYLYVDRGDGTQELFWAVFPQTSINTLGVLDSAGLPLWYRMQKIDGSTQILSK